MVSRLFKIAGILLVFAPSWLEAQTRAGYMSWALRGDSLLSLNKASQALFAYTEAFAKNNWKGLPDHRFNFARAYARLQNSDSAFAHLFKLVTRTSVRDPRRYEVEKDFAFLCGKAEWKQLMALIDRNRSEYEARLIQPVATELASILVEDQKYRLMSDSVREKYGIDSDEVQSMWALIQLKDSINSSKVVTILDRYGWLTAEETGDGHGALFLVIQHAKLPVQEKYLPMMREAVKNGKARAADLALLEDRVLMRNDKKQIYGSQIRVDLDGSYWIYPIEDPINVDKRRASVGLQPLAEYVSNWNLTWDPQKHLDDQNKKK